MAPPQAKSNKRRTRKRRRRAVDTSSSSSSSATSSEDERPSTVAVPMKKPATPEPASSSTSSASSSDSEDFNRIKQKKGSSTNITDVPLGRDTELPEDRPKRSPSPPVVKPLSFMASMEKSNSSDTMEKEKLLKERFRKFWMSSIADEFKNDLEEIRKEPNLTTSRLSMLIDALASGADVFSSGSGAGPGGSTNEMELVLNSESR